VEAPEMSGKFTVVLAVLVVILAGLIFIFKPLAGSTKDRDRQGNQVLQFELEDVLSLKLYRGEDVLTFQKTPSGWVVRNGVEDRAFEPTLYEVLALAQNLAFYDVIRGPEFDREFFSRDFGLSNPRERMTIELKKGELGLMFGREGSGDDRVYVRREDSKDTFLVADTLHTAINRPVDDFRDRRLASLTSDLVERVTVSRAGGEVELQRVAGRWKLIKPLAGEANHELVEGLLETLLGTGILEFVGGEEKWSENRAMPREDVTEIRFWPEGEDEPLILRLAPEGEIVEEEMPTYLAYYVPRKATLRLSGDPVALARVPLDRLRSEVLLDLNLDLVDRIGLRFDGETARLERAGEGWSSSKPEVDESALAEAVDTLLQELALEKISAFRSLPVLEADAAPSGSGVELLFNAWLSENTPEAPAGEYPVRHLLFTQDDNGDWQVRIDNRPEVCQVAPSALEALRSFAAAAGLNAPAPDNGQEP